MKNKVLPTSLMNASETVLRRLSTHQAQLNTDKVPYEHTIMLTTAMVESYVDDLLRALIAASGVDGTAFGAALLAEAGDGLHNSWKNRYGWLQRAFGITVAGSKERQEFDCLVELRNALAHGGGGLSPRQQSNLASMVSLEAQLEATLHVQARGGRLRLTPESAVVAVLICRRFVLCLDRSTRSTHPSLDY